MRMRSVLVATVGAAMVAALSTVGVAIQTPPPAQAPAAMPAGNAQHGKTLYVRYGCYQCHNGEAQGGAAGPRLGPVPIPFRGFVAYVRSPRGDMPPYTEKVMSERELADVYAFLQALPRPPALSSIPLLAR